MKAIEFYINGKKNYLLPNDAVMTEEEMKERNEKFYRKGYKERMTGYYDKWYRYNTFDNGAAYDKGVSDAVLNPDCVKDCYIIECIESQI